MKNNFFGAVSAALVLALSIASFGCESGDDTPVRIPEDDYSGNGTFTYKAAPTDYVYNANFTETAEAADTSSEYGSWKWESYKDGENKWNRLSGTPATTAAQAVRGSVKGDEIGDVVQTKEYTITFNGAGTWTLNKKFAEEEVLGINAFTKECDVSGAAYDEYVARLAYDAYVDVPVYFVNDATGLTQVFSIELDHNDEPTELNIHPGYYLGKPDGVLVDLEALKKDVEALLPAWNDAPEANKTKIADAEAVIDDINDWINLIKACKAAYDAGKTLTKIVKTFTSEDNFLTYSTKYYADKLLVSTIVTTDGETKPDAGTFKLVKGNFKNGTILITSDNDYSYFDDDDYYMDGGWRGVISADFETTDDKDGKPFTKEARTLTIKGGVLTAPAVRLTKKTAADFENGWYLPIQTPSIKLVYEENTRAATAGLQNISEESCKFKLQ